MDNQRSKSRNTKQLPLDPHRVFWEMACDLNLTQNPDIQEAYSLLCAKKYVSFMSKAETWSQQMYDSAGEHARWNQLAALLQKYPFDDPSIDRRSAARKKFLHSEHRCSRLNTLHALRKKSVGREHPAMQFMRDFIFSTIGSKPNFKRIFARCDFGPGSTVSVTGSKVGFDQKLSSLTCTPSCIPYALPSLLHNIHYTEALIQGIVCYDSDWLRSNLSIEEVHHNKIAFVPKNAKTDRTIAIEPTLNTYVQKGIDLEMRSLLLKRGIDLSDQSRNQFLARIGSRDGDLVTIDLSAASDSISVELVRSLIPAEWFRLLNDTRSHYYELDSEIRKYEKFCSMGNGFCFPLETLLFASAVAYANSVSYQTHPRMWHVYGDDIICDRQAALVLKEVLAYMGFKINSDKSFFFGPFRESCGTDYYLGTPVRPLYLKRIYKNPFEIFPFINACYRSGYSRTWQYLLSIVPRDKRFVRPDSMLHNDDSALTVPTDMFMSSRYAKWNRHTMSWRWTRVLWKPLHYVIEPRFQLANILRGTTGNSDTVSQRSRVTPIIVKQ